MNLLSTFNKQIDLTQAVEKDSIRSLFIVHYVTRLFELILKPFETVYSIFFYYSIV